MKNLVFLSIILFGFISSGLAQDDTYNKIDRAAQLSNDTMSVEYLVIPANPELYNSFYDRKMTELNKVDFYTLRDTILESLSFQVAEAFLDSSSSGVLPESRSGYKEDMDFVYESIEYAYVPIPAPPKNETQVEKWKSKLKKPGSTKPKKTGTYMEQGQIVTSKHIVPKYTNIKVINNDFLFVLNQRYDAEKFILINKFEMEIATSISQLDIQSDNYPREIRVHYTVVNVEGKELTSGVIIRNSSSYDDQLEHLINDSFKNIGSELSYRYFHPVQ